MAGSVLTAKCASCTCTQPGVPRGEKSWACGHPCCLALRADSSSCISPTHSGGPTADQVDQTTQSSINRATPIYVTEDMTANINAYFLYTSTLE